MAAKGDGSYQVGAEALTAREKVAALNGERDANALPACSGGGFIIAFTLQLDLSARRRFLRSSTFWKSRGHWCLPFSPLVLACIYIAQRVQHCYIALLVDVDT